MRVWADCLGEPTQTPGGKLVKNIFLEETEGAYQPKADPQTIWYNGIMGSLFGEYAKMKFKKGDMVVVDLQFSCRPIEQEGSTRWYNGVEVRSINKFHNDK